MKKPFFFFLVFFLLLPSVSFGNQIAEINYLLKKARADLREALEKEELPREIFITGIFIYGAGEREKQAERKFFLDSIEKIYFRDFNFRFQKIPKLFRVRMIKNQELNKVRVLRGPRNNEELTELVVSQQAGYYVEIYLFMSGRRISLAMYVHEAENSDMVWNRTWSTRPHSRTLVYLISLLYSQPFKANEQAQLYFSNFFGGEAIKIGEYGIFTDLGFDAENLLKQRQPGEPLKDINVYLGVGPRVALNVLEMANANYNFVEFYPTLRVGYLIKLLVLTTNKTLQSELFVPKSKIIVAPGLTVNFNAGFVLSAEFDALQLALTAGMGFRF